MLWIHVAYVCLATLLFSVSRSLRRRDGPERLQVLEILSLLVSIGGALVAARFLYGAYHALATLPADLKQSVMAKHISVAYATTALEGVFFLAMLAWLLVESYLAKSKG